MRIFNLRSFSSVYRPNSGWVAFFLSIFVWCLVIALLGASVVFAGRMREPGLQKKPRPSFYFRRKYAKFYALELFYGAGVLFATAGIMALANSAFALTVPKPMKG